MIDSREQLAFPILEPAHIERLRAIDPEVTGMPFLGSFMIEQTQGALRRTAWLGGALLLFWIVLSFRAIRPAALAMAPALATVLLLGGVMRLCGLAWNPLNIMALPVILGIAVDDGVHLVHRILAEKGRVSRALTGTGRSLLLTTATTLAAFGALALTSHRGLASFAQVLCLGVGIALVLTLIGIPSLWRVFAVPRSADAASSPP